MNHRELKRALAESETRFAALIETLSEGIVICDREGQITLCNKSAERILGYPREQLVGRQLRGNWRTIRPDGSPFPADDYPAVQVLRGSGPQQRELVGLYRPDDSLVWLEINVNPIGDASEPAGVVISFIDVTHYEQTKVLLGRQANFRARLIALLQASFERELDDTLFHEMLQLAIDTIPGAQAGSLVTLGADGKYRFAAIVGFNAEVLSHIAFSPEELQQDLSSAEPQLIYNHHDPSLLQPDNARYLAQDAASLAIKVTLAVPIFIQGQPVAIVNLDNFDTPHAFDGEAIAMAQTLAAHLGALWQRLALESAQRQDREALSRQAYFREGLNTLIQTALTAELDESLYQQFLETAVEVIPAAQAGSLMLRSGDKTFHFVAAVNFDLDELRQVYFHVDDIEELEREPLVLRNLAERPMRLVKSDQLVRYATDNSDQIKATLSIPVLLGNTVVALFNLDNFDDPAAFNGEAIAMGQIFAGQIAALLQRFELERALAQEREALKRLAFYDPLTGLPNRALLDERIRFTLASCERNGQAAALLFLDIDNFKNINDALGHDIGDLFLKAVAQRLNSLLRDGDTLARWGGDEFVILLSNLSKPEEAAYAAQKLIAAMREPFHVESHTLSGSVSIGIDTYPPSKSADVLIKHADTALYRAKAAGKASYLFFTQHMNAQLKARLALEHELGVALSKRQLKLVYQPRVALASGQITSVEALVRWQHPELGLIPPVDFIPLAEESGLILPLGLQVLELACCQAKAWLTAGTPKRVAVNISAKQLLQGDLATTVAQLLKHHQLPACYLELELTESAAMTNVKACQKLLERLKALGVYLSLDDFGTAYSSLNYLRRFPFDSLKIDKSFTAELDDPQLAPDASIARAIVALGHSLGLTVVAEGVESYHQLQELKRMGCDEAQGFYLCRPLPAEALPHAIASTS